MISENELRELIREYCRTEFHKAKSTWADKNIQEFRQILNEVKDTGNYELLKKAIHRLHSGKNALRFYFRTIADLENLWQNFLKEIVETRPEELLENIDERFEKWKKINGAGKGLISETLAFYYPDYFVPWNNVVDWYFQELGWGKPTKYSEVLFRFKELRSIFEEECSGGEVDFVIVDHFGWWLQVKVATKDLSKNLASLLKELKAAHKDDWASKEKEFKEYLQKIKELAKKGNSITEGEFKELLNIINKIHELLGMEVLWLWGSAKASVEVPRDILSRSDFQELMQIVEEINDIKEIEIDSEIIKLILQVMSAPHAKLSTLSSWLFVFNPKVFFPIHSYIMSEETMKRLGLNKFWAIQKYNKKKLRKVTEEYLRFLSALNIAVEEASVKDMSEAVFYFTKKGRRNGSEPITLKHYFDSQGYSYPPHLVSQFYVALKTKGFVILSGLTGTGKTKIAQQLAKLLDGSKRNFLFLPVRPDWRDSKALLGYYNPLTGEYHKTPLLEFIIDAIRNYVFSKDYLHTHKVWFIRCGEEGNPNKYASTALGNGYISIGWNEIEDMRKLSDQELENLTRTVDPLGQTLKFFKEISKGDIILMPLEKSRNLVAIGIVSSDYYYVPEPTDSNPQKHRRDVMWLGSFEISFEGIPVTIQEVRDDTSFLNKETLQRIFTNDAKPYFVLLDEMNLAHVEYYFADFLSILESGRNKRGFTREGIPLHDNDRIEIFEGIPKKLYLPPSLYIIGTVNMDETTYSFSPKVLDRAFVMEFHDVNLEKYPPDSVNEDKADEIKNTLRTVILEDLAGSGKMFLARSKEEANKAVKEFKSEHSDYWSILIGLNKALEPYDMHFGYRIVDEIALFFKNAKESEEASIVKFENDDEIFDLAILMKILPKFHGNRKRLEKPLLKVLEFCIEREFEVKFKENNSERTLKITRDLENLNNSAIIEMLTNWEKKGDEKDTKNEKSNEPEAKGEVVDDKGNDDKKVEYGKNFRFKHTAKKVLRMLRQLYEIGFASFS